MVVTGYYPTSPSTASGFIRMFDGTLDVFGIPGALWTEPESINDFEDVTGFYELVTDTPQPRAQRPTGAIMPYSCQSLGQQRCQPRL
jgi:hypothetical protein